MLLILKAQNECIRVLTELCAVCDVHRRRSVWMTAGARILTRTTTDVQEAARRLSSNSNSVLAE